MEPKAKLGADALSGAPIVDGDADVAQLFTERRRRRVESVLPRWLRAQRWFAGKAREIRATKVVVAVPMSEHSVYSVIRVHYAVGEAEDYAVPLCWLPADSPSPTLHPANVLARTANVEGFLCDAAADTRFHDDLFRGIVEAKQFNAPSAQVQGFPQEATRVTARAVSEVIAQEQSNTSIRFGDGHVLKLFRKLEPGVHPDVEMARFLGREPRFPHVARLTGALELAVAPVPDKAQKPETETPMTQSTTLAMLSEWVPHAGDAWTHVVEMAEADLGQAAGQPTTLSNSGMSPSRQNERFAASRALITRLAERTAKLHVRLASEPNDSDFAPEPLRRADREGLVDGLQRQAYATRALLRNDRQRIPERWRGHVAKLLDEPRRLLQRFEALRSREVDVVRIRCHGDLHLGQVLYQDDANGEADFVFLDFEGEPARPLRLRRIKSCALRDVAGMVRSLDYAAWMAHRRAWGGEADVTDAVLDATTSQWAQSMGAAFLQAYRDGLEAQSSAENAVRIAPLANEDFELILDAYLVEKAMYELGYELNHRPDWVDIPLRGIARVLGET